MVALVTAAIVILLAPGIVQRKSGTASLEGTVVDVKSGKVISNAVVEVTGVAMDGRVLSYSTKTATDGRFSIFGLAPGGGYQIISTRPDSYLPAHYGQPSPFEPGRPITLIAGEHIQGLEIRMTPTSEVLGRITYHDGRLARHVRVDVLKPSHGRSNAGLEAKLLMSTQTNDRGEYRLKGLPPGQYYVRAIPSTNALFAGPAVWDMGRLRRDLPTRVETEGYPPTYFPGTTFLEDARRVDLPAGTSLSGIDILAIRVRPRRVSGVIVNGGTGKGVRLTRLVMIPREIVPDSVEVRSFEVRDSFDILGVLPGAYWLVAISKDGQVPLFGRVPIDVIDSDVRDIVVEAMPEGELDGRLYFDGDPHESSVILANAQVTLSPRPPSSLRMLDRSIVTTSIPIKSVVEKGSFKLQGLRPWDYRVTVSLPTPNAYVAAARLGSVNVLEEALRYDARASSELEIVIAADGGSVEGQVVNEKAEPVGAATVAIVPGYDRRRRLDLYRDLTTDDLGQFKFDGLEPGSYWVLAWEGVERGAWYDRDFLRLYEGQGKEIYVNSRSNQNFSLPVCKPWM